MGLQVCRSFLPLFYIVPTRKKQIHRARDCNFHVACPTFPALALCTVHPKHFPLTPLPPKRGTCAGGLGLWVLHTNCSLQYTNGVRKCVWGLLRAVCVLLSVPGYFANGNGRAMPVTLGSPASKDDALRRTVQRPWDGV